MKSNQPIDAADLRCRAEERLKNRRGPDQAPGSEAETQRLIHELQVHQIELEIQNEELQNSRAEVEELLERYIDLYDFAPAGYFTLERDGTIAQTNLTGARLLNLERARLEGSRFGAFVADSDRLVFNAFLEKVFASRLNQVRELVLQRNGLPHRTVQIEGKCSPDGQTLRAVVVDITELKQEEEERKRLLRELFQARKMKALGVLAGGIAHDFNNLLAIILGNIKLSQLKLPPQSDLEPYLDNAMTAILRSRDLVQQILTFSHKGKPDLKPVSLPLVINETSNLLRATIPATVEINCDLPHQQLTINGDSTQIQEVLINLCNNAVRAMGSEGVLQIKLDSLRVRQTDIPQQYTVAPGPFARLSVRDSGSGIAPEVLEKIFDPFFTTKGVGEGSGMGLAVVHGILETHGGFANVTSQLGQGSTFEVFLPLIDSPPAERAEPEAEIPRGKERILFIDDEAMLAHTWSELLSEYGYQVTTETRSPKALDLFRKKPEQFDLVISDQTMPELSGKDLIKQLLKIRPELPTILCTGYSDKINEGEALKLGASAFLMKPFDLPKLAQAIRQALEKNQR